jgi:hypothetical protein
MVVAGVVATIAVLVQQYRIPITSREGKSVHATQANKNHPRATRHEATLQGLAPGSRSANVDE